MSKLGNYISIEKKGIEPNRFPKESFYYYSLPDFDNNQKPGLTFGDEISSNKFEIETGVILISKLNPRIRRVWKVINDEKYRSISSTEFVVLKTSDCDLDYLYYFLQTDNIYKELESVAIGSTNSHTRFKPDFLDTLEVTFPRQPQQKKIAKILSTVDNVIEKTENAIAKYEAIKQGLMHDLFTRGIDVNTGRLRPTPQEAPELYKESVLGLIPKEWEARKLGDVGDAKMCKRIFSYQTKNEGDIPFYKIGTFGKKPDAFISKELYKDFKNKYSFPSIGSILISASGTIGRLVVYKGEDAYFQDSNIVWIENDFNLISNEYLKYIFPLVKFKTEGGTIQRLYNNILKSGVFACPSDSLEQGLIINNLTVIDNKIQTEQQALAKYQQLKAGLLQDLLTGKVEVGVE